MTSADNGAPTSLGPEIAGKLSEAELTQLEQLHEVLWSSVSTATDRSAYRSEIQQRAEKRLSSSGEIDSKVMAHAIAHDHVGPDCKYRVMLDWMNDWVKRVESSGRFGPFSDMELIGTGAFGAVFSARQGHRRVAVKMARIEALPSEWQTLEADVQRHVQLLNEVRRHSQINVKGCVQVLEATAGIPSRLNINAILVHLARAPVWFSMQLIDGPGTLRDVMVDSPDGMEWDQAMRLMKPVAKTLSQLHRITSDDSEAAQLIHKDLKPENILIDEHGEPWVADFGLTTPRAGQRHVGNRVSGTLHYMAPEQFTTEFVNAQTDIWAWGVIVYELVTGRLPFNGETLAALRDNVVAAKPDAPSVLAKENLPAYADFLVRKCLSRERDGDESRFLSFADVLTQLNAAAKNKRTKELLNQLRLPALTTIGLVGLIIVGFVLKQARFERDASDAQVTTNKRLDGLEDQYEELRSQSESLLTTSGRLSPDQVSLANRLIASDNGELRQIGVIALKDHRIAERIDYFMVRVTWLSAKNTLDMFQQMAVNPDIPTIIRAVQNVTRQLRAEAFSANDLPKDFQGKFVEVGTTAENLIVESLRLLDLIPIGDNATFSKTWSFIFVAGTDLFESDGGMTGRMQKRILALTESLEQQTKELEQLAIKYSASDPAEDKSLPKVLAIGELRPPAGSDWFLYAVNGEKLFGKDPRKLLHTVMPDNEATLQIISSSGYTTHKLDSDALSGLELDLTAMQIGVFVRLEAFTFYSGHYVVVGAGANYEAVSVTYSDGDGRQQSQLIGDLSPAGAITLDPSEVNWTVGPNQTITIRATDCVERSVSTNDLLP